jgi:hypothetical protein
MERVSTAPWLVLGSVLAVVLLALVVLVAVLVLRGGRRRLPEPPTGAPQPVADDLPGFLEHPPGTPGSPAAAAAGWSALTAHPLPPPEPAAAPPPSPRPTLLALGGLAVTTLLLVGVAAVLAVAAQTRGDEAAAPSGTTAEAPPDLGDRTAGALAEVSLEPGRDGLASRLSFGGIVLERRAVGVTATYPVVRASSDGEDAVAHVELPTYNCLTDEAPDDPVAAGCHVSLTEYADLPTPELDVSRDGDRLRLSGAFPTYLRPNGTPPKWTGHVYELTITVEPTSGDPGDGPVPATGVLQLGADRTGTTGEDGQLRFGS